MSYTVCAMPSSDPRPHLVPVYTAERGILEGPAIRLAIGETVLGRDEGTGLLAFPGDSLVSRRHARLTVNDEPWRVAIEDLSSKNGTFVNGRPIETIGLVDGDVVRMGQSFFVVRWRSRPEESASDIPGRAPGQIRMRADIERIDPHVRLVMLHGGEGCVFDNATAAIHRRMNPEGGIQHLDGAQADSDVLNRLLSGAATVVVSNVESLQPEAVGLLAASPMAPIIATTTADPDALMGDGLLGQAAVEFQRVIRIPRLVERRDDLLGLLKAALGEDSPPISIDLIETLLIYGWPGDVMELIEVATELRIRGAGLDALVTELVSPRLRGGRTGRLIPNDPLTQVDVRRPVPSRPDLEGLMTIHNSDVDAIAGVLGRSRMQVMAWIRQYGLDEDDA